PASRFLAVAASIFLTRPVKGSLTSRAKMAATGLGPFLQTKQAFLPASSPVTFNGVKGPGSGSPACGPGDRLSAAHTLQSTAQASDALAAVRNLMMEAPSS